MKLKLIIFGLILCVTFSGAVLSTRIVTGYAVGEPTSIAYISAGSELGENGWYKSAVSVTIEGTSADVASLTYWLNGNPPSTASGTITSQTFAQNGENTLYYFATDSLGVRELATNQLQFKIDTVSPKSWRLFNPVQNGNNHTFNFSITVDDTTSGLNSTGADIQYSTDGGQSFGFHTPSTSCNNFTSNGWISLTNQQFSSGATTGQLSTPTIDVCNSNWDVCKILRFRVKDMAGNVSERKICLFGAWMQTSNGNVFSKGPISMNSAGPEDNNDGIVFSEGQISNFTSTTGHRATPYPLSDFDNVKFSELAPKYIPKSNSLPSGRLPTQTGWYYYNGNLTISNTTFPTGFSTATGFSAIVLVNGDLNIRENINTHDTSSIMFVNSGDLDIDKSVTNLEGIFVSEGQFDSSYNGNSNNQLIVNGAVWAGGGFDLSRTLQNNQNSSTPAELFVFQPRLFMQSSLVNLLSGSNRFVWKEVIE